jgi:hypothetical protein
LRYRDNSESEYDYVAFDIVDFQIHGRHEPLKMVYFTDRQYYREDALLDLCAVTRQVSIYFTFAPAGYDRSDIGNRLGQAGIDYLIRRDVDLESPDPDHKSVMIRAMDGREFDIVNQIADEIAGYPDPVQWTYTYKWANRACNCPIEGQYHECLYLPWGTICDQDYSSEGYSPQFD